MRTDPLGDGISFVELIGHMGDDQTVVESARVSYLGESKGPEKDKRLLGYLFEHGHMSPLEQVVFRFRVKAPMMVTRQWMRYRAGSFNEQSRRYTEVEDADEFYVPEVWRLQDADNKQGSIGVLDDVYLSTRTTNSLNIHIQDSLRLYHWSIQNGIAREQARVFLPAFCLYSTFVWQVNLRNLLHFLYERTDSHAQYEIRMYANDVKTLVTEITPWCMEFWENCKPT